MTNTTEVIAKLRMAQVSSCSCLTKTPEVSWHDAACRYRAIAEAIDVITSPPELAELQATIARLKAEIEVLNRSNEEYSGAAVQSGMECDRLQSEIERLKDGCGEHVAELSQHLESVIAMFAPGEDRTNRTLIAARTCLDKVKELNQ